MKLLVMLFILIGLMAICGTCATNATGHGNTDNTPGVSLSAFGGYLEFAEWVSSYEVPELDGDCDDYAFEMFIDGLNKGYWVSCQLEMQESKGHMFVAGYIKYADGKIRPRFVDAETRKIYKKMYGYMWRLD